MKHKFLSAFRVLLVAALGWGLGFSQARGEQGPEAPEAPPVTSFTYQGSLKQAGSAVNAMCDFQFGLYDAQSLGTQLGVTQTLTSTVSGGLFSVQLNGTSQFGSTPFNGSSRWLAVNVRCPMATGSYTGLGRQELNAVPYALFSLTSDSTNKLQGVAVSATAPVTGQSLKYNGTQWAPGGYQGYLVVAKSGGDFTTISDALASLGTTPSEANRYLIKVMPGVYTETVTMKSYVDIEGSGELTTRITNAGSSTAGGGTLVGANNAELRSLTVANTGAANYAIAIRFNNATTRLRNITAKATGGTSGNRAINIYGAGPMIAEVTATAAGGADAYGIMIDSAVVTMTNVIASSSGATSHNYGISSLGSSMKMNSVTASASGGSYSYGIYNESCTQVTLDHVAASASGTSPTIGFGIYNDLCNVNMSSVSAKSSAGAQATGVQNVSSTVVMDYVTASASGNNLNMGVYNNSSSENASSPLLMNHVTVSATGGNTNYAVDNSYSYVVIQDSTITASGGAINNYGVYNSATSGSTVYILKVNNSQVTGVTATLRDDANYNTKVGASLLSGGAVTGGGFTCAGVFDEAYTFYGNSCP